MSGRTYWDRNRSARRARKERTVVQPWLDAFSVLDAPCLVVLLTDDAWLRMPPMPFEYRGPAAAERFFTAMGHGAPRRMRFRD